MSLETINWQHLKLHGGERILDLGCGEGRHSLSAALQANVSVVGLDLAVSDLNTARSRWPDVYAFVSEDQQNNTHAPLWVCGSGLQLPFADHTFDVVVCSEVLEHIPDYPAVLSEINRVVKVDGRLAVSVPRYWPEWVCWQLSRDYHEVPGGHVRIFRAPELHDRIAALGFRRTSRHWAHSLHVPYWWLRCLFWSKGENAFLPRLYHKFLVWDLMKRPRITHWLDHVLNPLMGKSVVFYYDNAPTNPALANGVVAAEPARKARNTSTLKVVVRSLLKLRVRPVSRSRRLSAAQPSRSRMNPTTGKVKQ